MSKDNEAPKPKTPQPSKPQQRDIPPGKSEPDAQRERTLPSEGSAQPLPPPPRPPKPTSEEGD